MDNETMTCPNCGNNCCRDSVHNGLGWMYGPWGCFCGWSESEQYNQLTGPKFTEGGTHKLDQWGGGTPVKKAASHV